MTALHSLRAAVMKTSNLKIFGFSMVRNEADIISAFIRQAVEMFDRFVFVDIMSTDGTSDILQQVEKEHSNIVIFKCRTKEKYQAAMMNFLAREAIREGADWLFFLDADEFLPVESRHELESYLKLFSSEVMSMPWINLVPSSYDDFSSFDCDQRFYWSGRTSSVCKVAVSSLYFHSFPDAFIDEGNHNIRSYKNGPLAPQQFGMPLLHLPVRSRERLKYKLRNSLRFLGSKHNTGPGEGSHVSSILDAIEGEQASKEYLNAIAADYGGSDHELEAIDPERLDWPVKLLPRYLATTRDSSPEALSLGATLAADATCVWREMRYVKGSPVTAALEGDELRIVAQPLSGSLQPLYGQFEALPPIAQDPLLQSGPKSLPKLLADALAVSLLPIKFDTMSAWSQLIPILFALFSIVRPRRYVELGVHNGMSFFAACQVSEHAQTNTECVAIDSWVGDPHASFYSSTVFEEFTQNLAKNYPGAFFIRGVFSHAVDCFENGSIDLLHIDGYHTYEAVKADFEDWLCKMSETGIVLFHDINVHERDFGVWQLWQELCDRHMGLSFMHSHGLGLLYVGRDDSAIASGFRWLNDNPAYFSAIQKYFEVLGENSIDYKMKSDDALRLKGITEDQDRQIAELKGITEDKNRQIAELDTSIRRLGLGDEWIVIPVNRELGNSIDHVLVVTKALKLGIRGFRIRRFLLWPFSARRRRYQKKLKIGKYLRRNIRVI